MRKIRKIGVAGSGTMGSGIAQIFASNGYDVILVDMKEEFLEIGKKIISINQENLIAHGLLSEEDATNTFTRIQFSTDKSVFHDCDLIIECIIEKLDIKKSFWKEVESIVSENCILASNTSGLSINAMSEDLIHKERFIGMHWWNPPHIIPLIELIKGIETTDEVVKDLQNLVENINKHSVVVLKDAPGFIGNRLQFALLREALNIVEEGIATVEDVDTAVRFGPGFRYPAIGPFQTADLGGLDTFYHICSYLFQDLSDAKEVPLPLKKLFEQGDLGVKSQRGFYDYSGGKDKEAMTNRDEHFFKQLLITKNK